MILLSGIPNLALFKPRGYCLKYILFQLYYLIACVLIRNHSVECSNFLYIMHQIFALVQLFSVFSLRWFNRLKITEHSHCDLFMFLQKNFLGEDNRISSIRLSTIELTVTCVVDSFYQSFKMR